jgi:hypothetical protein
MNSAIELILVTLLASLVAQPAPSAAPVNARSERAYRDRGHRDR